MFLHIGIVEKQFHVIMDISFYPNKWSPYITSPSWKGTKLRKMKQKYNVVLVPVWFCDKHEFEVFSHYRDL